MKTKLSKIFALMIVATMIVSPVAAQTVPDDPTGLSMEAADATTKNVDGTLSIYLVRLSDAPLVSYRGGIEGYPATSPAVTGANQLDVNSPAAQAYTQYLVNKQADFIASVSKTLARSVEVEYQYFAANNGLAIYLSPSELEQVSKNPEVIFMQPDFERELQTDNGPAWIGAPGLWDGTNTGGLAGTYGEGMIVGVIDTGINPLNPSFLDIGGDGYDHDNPLGPGNYVGVCDLTDPTYDPTFPCNDKLIGARGYATVNAGDPTDYDGHGSHTASTSAGNVVTATVSAPTIAFTRTISGVAPHANIIAYAACCTGSALSAAIDDAVADGVNVINYSIGSTAPSDVWNDFDTVGYLAAREAGIFVATSAGNEGPGEETVGSPADAPWLTSVGNSTHNRVWFNSLESMTGGDTTPPADIQGKGVTSGYGPAEIIYAGDLEGTYPGAALCGTGPTQDVPDGTSSPFPPGTFSGEIVVCDRGTYGRVEKGFNVMYAGAGGYILANDVNSGNALVGDAHHLPAVHITYNDGVTLKAWLASGTGHMGSIAGMTLDVDPANGDVMASGSSRGANRALPDIIVPSVTAPGTDILAAYGVDGAIEWDMISGTSMASPHVAGAGALLMNLHPSWTPAEIQSALMTTGVTAMFKEDGSTPTDPFDMGGGRIDLTVASKAGLVLDESIANYEAADPSLGGDPKTLNIPSFGNSGCLGTCSWVRTVSSTQAVSVTWTAATSGPMTLTVDPPVFEIGPGGTQVITVTADASALPVDTWEFGEVTLDPSDAAIPSANFPVAIQYATGSVPERVVIETDDVAGAYVIEDIITLEADPLLIAADGLEMGTATDMSLDQDPTNGDPYDNLNDGTVEYITVSVPADGLRLVAEITSSEAPDIDLFVGTGTTPSAATEVCASTTGSWNEYCNIIGDDLVAGDWWILVQNWNASANAPDDVTLVSAVVDPGNLANFTATGPASVAAGAEYDVDLTYNVPAAMPGDRYYGAVTLADGGTPLATIDVDLHILPTEMLMVDGPAVTFDLGMPHTFTVTEDAGAGLAWSVNGEDSCVNDGNYTGGSGLAACASSDYFGPAAYDTSLISNEVDFSSADSCDTVTLDFLVNYRDVNNPTQSEDRLDVDVSTDGGTTWTTELTLFDDIGGFFDLPGVAYALDLIDYLTADSIHVRFRYYNPDNAAPWDWYAQVDDVSLNCVTSAVVNVNPTSLAADVSVFSPVTTTLTISNTGTAALNYNVYEDGGAAPTGINSVNAVLWEQAVNGTGGIISDMISGTGFGTYSAEDFVLPGRSRIDQIYTPGFDNGGDITTLATAVSWWIFADDGGAPLGNPAVNAGAGDAVWHHTDVPTGTGIDITNNEITLDLVAATGSGVELVAGRYWLVVAPTVADDPTRWNWYQGVGQDNQAMLFDEGNFGGLPWTTLGGLGLTFQDLAFSLEGEVLEVLPCDVSNDMPWLSVAPASGTIEPGGLAADVIVTYDATGLNSGQRPYRNALCR